MTHKKKVIIGDCTLILIELDEEYFNIGCKRIKDAYRQADMFTEQPAIIERMTQDNLI